MGARQKATQLASWWLDQQGRRKRFTGSIFDRFIGLEPLLEDCAGEKILDIGACDGLVAYEFARAGAALIHGFEQDEADVLFARRLFRDVPAESAFFQANLAVAGEAFECRYGDLLAPRYDTLLLLGVYHHLRRQAGPEAIESLIDRLLQRTTRRVAVRTKQIEEAARQLVAAGFEPVGEEREGAPGMGPLRIFVRES